MDKIKKIANWFWNKQRKIDKSRMGLCRGELCVLYTLKVVHSLIDKKLIPRKVLKKEYRNVEFSDDVEFVLKDFEPTDNEMYDCVDCMISKKYVGKVEDFFGLGIS
tara:strand:+ start:22 stop:339 length:318 start_codon:yes stop_codon:yes gene_type:complete